MNHRKFDQTLNVKEKCLQQTRLPKRLGRSYACKVQFACSHVLGDVNLQVDLPPPHSHTLSIIPIKLHKQSLSTATVGVASRPHPLRLKPTECVAGGFVPITDSRCVTYCLRHRAAKSGTRRAVDLREHTSIILGKSLLPRYLTHRKTVGCSPRFPSFHIS